MKLLLHEELAPLTTTIAFFDQTKVEQVVTALNQFFSKRNITSNQVSNVVSRQLAGDLSIVIKELLPLTNGVMNRHLVIETKANGVAYFNNFWRGDLGSVYAYLPPMIQAQCITIGVEPRTLIKQSNGWTVGRFGMCKFGLHNNYGNTVRYIAVLGTDDGFDFISAGKTQPFEDIKAYSHRIKKNRFTFDILKQYCASFGLRPFDEDFYNPEQAWLIEEEVKPSSQTFDLKAAWEDFQPSC